MKLSLSHLSSVAHRLALSACAGFVALASSSSFAKNSGGASGSLPIAPPTTTTQIAFCKIAGAPDYSESIELYRENGDYKIRQRVPGLPTRVYIAEVLYDFKESIGQKFQIEERADGARTSFVFRGKQAVIIHEVPEGQTNGKMGTIVEFLDCQ